MPVGGAQDHVRALGERLRGSVQAPGGADWEEECSAFNLAAVPHPQLLVCAADRDDVAEAVRYAGEQGLPVGVLSTGHGCALGPTTIDRGLLISTRRMQELRLDPERHSVTVGPGVTWKQVMEAAAPYGLAALCGSSSGVGVTGFCLGGGLPVLGRAFGFAADHVEELEVVTGDGEVRRVDREHNPDLFWGLRGGKGNLGVVTSLTISLPQVASVYGGCIFYGQDHIAEVLRAFPAWASTLGTDSAGSVAVLRLPPLPQLPEPLRGQTVVQLRFCHLGEDAEGARLLEPMRGLAPALIDGVQRIPYSALDSVHMDPDSPLPYEERGGLLRELPPEAVEALLGVVGPEQRVPILVCELRLLGGELSREPEGGNAIGARDAAFTVFAVGVLTPETAPGLAASLDAVVEAVRPWSTGHTFANFHGQPGDAADRARAWTPDNYQRLRALAQRYDPEGLFRFGLSVRD